MGEVSFTISSVLISAISGNYIGAILKISLFQNYFNHHLLSISIHSLAFGLSQTSTESLLLCVFLLYSSQVQKSPQDHFFQLITLLLSSGIFTPALTSLFPPILTLIYIAFRSSHASSIEELKQYHQRIKEENAFYLTKLESLKKNPTQKQSPMKRSSTLLNKLRTLRSQSMVKFYTEGSDNESPHSELADLEFRSRKSSMNVEESSENTGQSASSAIEAILPGISNEEVKEIINTLISQEYLVWNPKKCGEDEVDVIAVALEAKNVFTQSIENLPGSSHRTIKIPKFKKNYSIRSMIELSEPLTDVLENIGEWDFDCFELIKVTKDPAFEVGLYIFNILGLSERFKIDNATLRKFLTTVELGYNRNNFYHNSMHAADVTASTLFLVQKGLLRCGNLIDLDVFALVVAALCHDIGHPGLNNSFLVATANELAMKYNDQSCLENMHANKAFSIINSEGCKITSFLSKADYQRFRKSAVSAILSTDLQVHFDKLHEFRANLDKKLDISDDKFRALAIQVCLKCADIGHGARKLNIHMNWTSLITKEFFKQGEKEKEFGIPVSPLCDRANCVISKSQVGFLEVLVKPLFTVWEEFIEQNNEEDSELEIKICMNNIQENILFWGQEFANVQQGIIGYKLDNEPPLLLNLKIDN